MQMHQLVIDLPTFGAGPVTVGDLLAEPLVGHIGPGVEILTIRFITPPIFEVRGLGDTALVARLLARAAIDNGFRAVHVILLEPLADDSVDLIDQIAHKLPPVISLEVTITTDSDQPATVLGPRATPAEFREHLNDAVTPLEDL